MPWRPGPPCFVKHQQGTFWRKKVSKKMLIISKFRQKTSSKMFVFRSTPPHFGQSLNMSRCFFYEWLTLYSIVLFTSKCSIYMVFDNTDRGFGLLILPLLQQQILLSFLYSTVRCSKVKQISRVLHTTLMSF